MRINKIPAVAAWMSIIAFSSSAFALTPGNGTWTKESNLFGLQDAQTYVPSNPNPAIIGTGRALMVTLHGCGQTASGNVINKMFNWEDTAEKYGMVVVAPTVPSGTNATRSVAGCWDWFGANHSRSTRDEAIILKLVDAIKSRANLNIDPNQIYVTGLSSGAGLVVDLACVAPDYFAGVGVNAGPELNETSTTLGSKAHFAPADEAAACKNYAGSFVNALTATQVASVVNGTADTFVDPSQDQVDISMFNLIYGSSTSNGTFTDVKSTGESWRDGNGHTRGSWVQATGMGHAWPAGAGGSGGGTYVDYTHINYPAYVTKFFFDNNLRVGSGGTTTTTTTTTTAAGGTTTTTATTTTTTVAATCYTSSNYAHVTAGRAHDSMGSALANGSNANMGLDNLFYSTTLKKTGTNYYVIGTCP
ncbi:MAG TPA: PHB depolymerase family esterase [Burkholderiaceae bacterium]|jgi:poly(3-hydroxybutyrate) depolymerase